MTIKRYYTTTTKYFTHVCVKYNYNYVKKKKTIYLCLFKIII